jgi:ureidoacrylate peracid hydrolase
VRICSPLLAGWGSRWSTPAPSTDGPALHAGALDAMRVLLVEVAPWRELIAPGARWDRALNTAYYGRDPAYWTEPPERR